MHDSTSGGFVKKEIAVTTTEEAPRKEKKAKKGRHNGERTAQGPTRNTCLKMKGPIFQGEASECEERIGYVFARTAEKGVGGNVV